MTFAPDPFPPLDPLDLSPALADLDDDERIMPLPKGPFADRYEVIRELGVGGMGIVYLAYDPRGARNVALKRIARNFPSCKERFRREYRALAAIRHRGVPAIYDISETAAGEPFFTMEIISGETIRAHLRRGPIEPLRALAMAIELARVLSAVHEVGVIHRDVKPDNVILETGDRVRLIDFGASVLTEDYYAQPHLRRITDVRKRWRTSDTEIIGAAAYTCPLWWNHGNVSARTDVFSVCVLLYEMITGRVLYSEETYRHREIRDDEFPPELAPLAAELRRGVSLIEHERHTTMAELVRALEIVRFNLADRRRRPPARWWAGVVMSASMASFVLGIVAAGSALTLWSTSSGTAPVDALAEAPEPRPLSCAVAAPREMVQGAGQGRLDDEGLALASSDAPSQEPPAERTRVAASPDPVGDLPAAVPGPASDSGRRGSTPSTPQERRPTCRATAPWDTRMRCAEAGARRCIEKSGATVKPLVVTLAADEAPSVRGVASDSPTARCVQDALARLDLEVVEGQRHHTFFAAQESSP